MYLCERLLSFDVVFFFNATATTEIYTLSLHDALPIYPGGPAIDRLAGTGDDRAVALPATRLTHADRNAPALDRKSTRLNSSHVEISYAVFCLKKKRQGPTTTRRGSRRGRGRHRSARGR